MPGSPPLDSAGYVAITSSATAKQWLDWSLGLGWTEFTTDFVSLMTFFAYASGGHALITVYPGVSGLADDYFVDWEAVDSIQEAAVAFGFDMNPGRGHTWAEQVDDNVRYGYVQLRPDAPVAPWLA